MHSMDGHAHSPSTPTSFLSPASPTTVSYPPISTSNHSHFHSFQRKFRRPSSSHSQDPPPDANTKPTPSGPESTRIVKSNEATKEAVREAKRFLNDHIRDDWSFDPWSDGDTPQKSAVDQKQEMRNIELPQPVDYIRRQSGSSDAPTDDEGYHDARDPMWVDGDLNDVHTFKFESPEDVGNAIRARRKVKRRRNKQEMAWNDGLSIWTARRNKWTGATKTRPNVSRISKQQQDEHLDADSSESRPDDYSQDPGPVGLLSPPDSRSDREPEKFDIESDDSEDSDEPYLPVQPPLIPPSNPIRAIINRDMYPTIYSKFVVQGLAPSVPLPLPHVIQSLIKGWKDEGNWPPRPSAPPAGSVEARRLTARGGSSVVAHAKKEMTRLARLGRDWEKERPKRGSVGGMGDAVRKAFRLRGHKVDEAGNTTGYGERDEGMEGESDILVAREENLQ